MKNLIGGWKFFGQGQFPEEGQIVTLIWNNGAETDCVWESEGMGWQAELLPISWKPIKQ